MLGIPVKDITGGLNLFRRATLEAIIDDITAGGYGIQRDLTFHAHRKGFRIAEVPIEFVERVRGQSKLGGDVVIEALGKTTRMGLAHRGAQVAGAVKDAGRLVTAVARTGARTVADLTKSERGGPQ